MITTAELDSIVTIQPPRARGYWHCIRHDDLIRSIETLCSQVGWMQGHPLCHLSKDQGDLVATWEIQNPAGKLLLSVINSNMQRRALVLYGGLYLCGVSMPMTTVRIGRHTKRYHNTMNERLLRGLGIIRDASESYGKMIDELRERTVHPGKTATLLMQAMRGKMIPWSRAGLVDKQFTDGKRTALNFLLCFCKVNQLSPPLKQMKQAHDFYRLLTKE